MQDNNKTFSSKQEKLIASYLDWTVIAGSGSRPTAVGDIRSDEWLGECKTHTTPNHSITFNAKVWAKIREEATAKFKHPALFVDDGSQLVGRTWCMFPLNVLDLSDATILDYPKPIKTNITFSLSDLKSDNLYKATYDDVPVIITGLATFELLLSGEFAC